MKKSKASPQNSQSSHTKTEDEAVPQFDDDEIQQVHNPPQEASGSQSNDMGEVPISSNGSDRDGFQLPPDAINDSRGAIDDSEVEGEENSPNIKKTGEQIPKAPTNGDAQPTRSAQRHQPKAPSKQLHSQKDLTTKQLNDEYRIR